MQLFEYRQLRFPDTTRSIDAQLSRVERAPLVGLIAIFGGTGRSALLEVILGNVRPVRDIDLAAISGELSDDGVRLLNQQLNPDDAANANGKVSRFASVEDLLKNNTDFTINQSVITLAPRLRLVTTPDAISACENATIQPTAKRIEVTKYLQELHEADPKDVPKHKHFRRNQTGMPARGAYFAAVLQSADIKFKVDMLDHPVPPTPADAHTFFLGLMVNKSMIVDETERGPGDITATRLLFDYYDKMGLTKGTSPSSPEDVVAYCEAVNDEHPQLKFRGSQLAGFVRHTTKEPEPRVA